MRCRSSRARHGGAVDLHPRGLRGGSEGGTTPALVTVMNAIVDAPAELGIEHMEMPATPERGWRVIHEARGEDF